MAVDDELVVKAATALVTTINSLTESQRGKCEILTLADVSLAVRYHVSSYTRPVADKAVVET